MKQKINTRGVLLVALGAPQYGNMAANLAASIRFGDPDVRIHLVHTETSISHLTPAHRALFSSIALCPTEYYTVGGTEDEGRVTGAQAAVSPSPLAPRPPSPKKEYIKAKTHIYDLTPFDETLFVDVDIFMLPHTRMGDVMDGLSQQCDYTIKNRGYHDLSGAYTHWFDVELARKHFKCNGRFYQCQSEFIFFKKTARNKAFFAKVKELFDTRPIPAKDFRGSVPDEYAYNLAMALTGTYPHADPYLPIYWYFLDGQADWNKTVAKKYHGFSLGGEMIPEWLKHKVDAYKLLYRQRLKLPYLFNVGSKKSWNKGMRV